MIYWSSPMECRLKSHVRKRSINSSNCTWQWDKHFYQILSNDGNSASTDRSNFKAIFSFEHIREMFLDMLSCIVKSHCYTLWVSQRNLENSSTVKCIHRLPHWALYRTRKLNRRVPHLSLVSALRTSYFFCLRWYPYAMSGSVAITNFPLFWTSSSPHIAPL